MLFCKNCVFDIFSISLLSILYFAYFCSFNFMAVTVWHYFFCCHLGISFLPFLLVFSILSFFYSFSVGKLIATYLLEGTKKDYLTSHQKGCFEHYKTIVFTPFSIKTVHALKDKQIPRRQDRCIPIEHSDFLANCQFRC